MLALSVLNDARLPHSSSIILWKASARRHPFLLPGVCRVGHDGMYRSDCIAHKTFVNPDYVSHTHQGRKAPTPKSSAKLLFLRSVQ